MPESGGGIKAGCSAPQVVFVAGRFASEGSGLERAASSLANALARNGLPVRFFATGGGDGSTAARLIESPNRCVVAPATWCGGLSRSPLLKGLLADAIRSADVVHNHSVWLLPNHYASQAAWQAGKPVLFTPHGMLDPYALRISRWKKRLVGWWFQDRDLHRSACLHVFSERELAGIRSYGLRRPIAVVPNGVDLEDFAAIPPADGFRRRFPETAGKRVCLFLSRLHPKKGLLHLLEAWQQVGPERPEWHLVIAGPDYGQESEVRRQIDQRGVGRSVSLGGPLYGAEKLAAMAAAEVFILPSFSEGFSMAVLEAMACGVPVIITPGCNFPEVIACGGGIEIDPTAEGTASGLREMLARSASDLERMGHRARQLVASRYTWSTIADKMKSLYCWLAGGGAPPPFVEMP